MEPPGIKIKNVDKQLEEVYEPEINNLSEANKKFIIKWLKGVDPKNFEPLDDDKDMPLNLITTYDKSRKMKNQSKVSDSPKNEVNIEHIRPQIHMPQTKGLNAVTNEFIIKWLQGIDPNNFDPLEDEQDVPLDLTIKNKVSLKAPKKRTNVVKKWKHMQEKFHMLQVKNAEKEVKTEPQKQGMKFDKQLQYIRRKGQKFQKNYFISEGKKASIIKWLNEMVMENDDDIPLNLTTNYAKCRKRLHDFPIKKPKKRVEADKQLETTEEERKLEIKPMSENLRWCIRKLVWQVNRAIFDQIEEDMPLNLSKKPDNF